MRADEREPVQPAAGLHRRRLSRARWRSSAALIGIAWHPLRLILPAMVIALIAAAMAPKGNRLAQAAVAIGRRGFFVGMLVAVVTQRPLW